VNRPIQATYTKGVTRADLERSFAALAGDELAELLDGLADWLERVRRR
jgi:hypothetical protein